MKNLLSNLGEGAMRAQTLSALAFALCLAAGPTTGHAGDAENTGINVRDRDPSKVTVFDQGGSEADRQISASIRKAVVDDDSLSMNAHNVKIITSEGVVTLRGPVDSAAEKASIEAKAQSVPGVAKVDSQLEVALD